MERLPEFKYSADLARKLRADAGKNVTETARMLGVEKRIWQMLEQQKLKIEISTIENFCKMTGLNPSEYVALALEGEKSLKKFRAKEAGAKVENAPAKADASEFKLYREVFTWTMDEAQEFFDISRNPLVRIESGQIMENSRIRFEDIRARYQETLVRAKQQAKSLFDQFKAGESDFVIESGEWFVIPVFENTATLQRFYPAFRIAGGTAAYYRYVAGQLLTLLLEAGRNAKLFLFKDETLQDKLFEGEPDIERLKIFIRKVKWT